ncbi:MAG TPA: ATP synthase F1 subunit gamma [Candidatus Saccharimonadales bacterium]|nr:ATP synthase F1 subunit gamma [Candidatus Saccharimonadales bacterium]
MATILALKRRINAARNVSKTTKAMQMIAASKLKRAQNAVASSKPYVNKIAEILENLLEEAKKDYTHPYLSPPKKTGKTLLLVLSPDKGLCGSLIANILKEFISYQKTSEKSTYVLVGKKLEGHVVHLGNDVVASFPFGTTIPTFDKIFPLLQIINDYYLSGKVDSVKILTAEYINIFTQKPKVTDLLPINPDMLIKKGEDNKEKTNNFYLFEPNKKSLLDSLLNHFVEMKVYHQLIESFLSEQASRMMSMQNATDSANDIIEDLQLEYNKTRQAKITSELLDITGASAVANYE